jgi:large conductance mechanosensitive channel
VGVIIGGAFGKLVTSMVDNVIMPLVGVILPGDKGYEKWAVTIGEKTVPYGKFIGDVVGFIILAAALFFFIVKFLGWLMKSKAAEAAAPPAPTKDQELLTEIRDLLKQR